MTTEAFERKINDFLRDQAVMKNDLEYIKKNIDDLKGQISQNYISRAEFEPIKKIVYGMVALVLTSVFGAILALIIQS